MRMTHDKLIDVVDFIFLIRITVRITPEYNQYALKESLQILLLVTTIITQENMGF